MNQLPAGATLPQATQPGAGANPAQPAGEEGAGEQVEVEKE